ncbi:alpha/beta fold hydrolase [Methylobacter tundripaludum]|uniref:alpha/beta fold hydrolase n=1 Tax=Methylobacter tundripaludum TaxID=173365 RepID=UPI0004DEFE01|nr:alpha/beta fold hydrolase [Methylobacter tundripaludum]
MPRGYGQDSQSQIPGLVLSLREQLEGGNLRKDVNQNPLPDKYARIEAVVLVHGFNNHSGEAAEAYLGFRSRQYTLASQSPPALEKELTDVFWPGDASGWGLFDLADAAVYPAAVGAAKAAALRLAKHLRSMPNLRKVHFIGHSLGCRLILETIDDLRLNGGPTVDKVCLMAAAVPVFKIQSIGSLAKAMEHAKNVRILYSENDWVLKYTFPGGQTLASGDEGRFPTALGLTRLAYITGRTEQVNIYGAGHSDYWGHPDSKEDKQDKRNAKKQAAASIASFFNFGRSSRSFAARAPSAAPRTITAEPRMSDNSRNIR